MRFFKAHVAFTSLFSLTLACVSVSWPSARAEAATSKKAPKKVTAASIVKWHRSGKTSDEILARVAKSSYAMSAKDKAVLTKRKVPKSVISALPKATTTAAVVETRAKGAKAIDIKTLTRPEDIDFDSVPPPKGMPKQYVSSAPTRAAVPVEPTRPERAEKTENVSRSAAGKKAAKEPVAAAEKPAQRRVVFSASE